MRAIQNDQPKSNKRKDIFSSSKQDQKRILDIQEMQLKKEEKENKEKKQMLNQSKGIFENGGFGNFAPRKRNYRQYRDMFVSNIDDDVKQPEEKISFQKMKNNFNNEPNSSYINSFYNEPSFFKKSINKNNSRVAWSLGHSNNSQYISAP